MDIDYKLESKSPNNKYDQTIITGNKNLPKIESILRQSIEDIERYAKDYPQERPFIDNLTAITEILDQYNPKDFNKDTFGNFPHMIMFLLDKHAMDFDIYGMLFQCIANLMEINDMKLFFIDQNLFESCQTMLTHEDDKIAEASLHILSEIIDYSIRIDLQPDEDLITNIASCYTLSYHSELYASRIFCLIAEFAPNPIILNTNFKYNFDQLYAIFSNDIKMAIIRDKSQLEFRSDFDRVISSIRYYKIRDEIRANMAKTIYLITQKDFSFYIGFKECFKFLFKSVNFMSSTLTDNTLLKYIFETLLLIINESEEEANEMIRLFAIRLQILCTDDFISEGEEEDEALNDEIDYDYDFYYYFLQNSDFSVLEPLLPIINFALTHLDESFYNYCIEKNPFIPLFFEYFDQGPFQVKYQILKYITLIVTHPDPGPTIKYLMPSVDVLKGNFIQLCSFVFPSKDYDSILNFHEILNTMIDYELNQEPDEVYKIVSFILDDEDIYEYMTQTQDIVAEGRPWANESEQEREEKIAFLNNKILEFCTKFRKDQEAGLSPLPDPDDSEII